MQANTTIEKDIKLIKENKKQSISDYKLITVLGKGSYAKVVLVRKIDNNTVYAIKTIKKNNDKKTQNEQIFRERNILIGLNFPFIIHLHQSFQNERKFFFVLEYCPGGELFGLLVKQEKFSENQTRFYAAQILLAIEYIHSQNIIYRDLKPENVLIDKDGYLRLTDFGLSKQNIEDNSGGNTVCGTPEYLAPEILNKSGHGKAVDYWTLGAIIYEMLTGMPPFYSQNRNELFERIKNGQLKYPQFISLAAKHLINNLLIKDPNKRLGTHGADQIKQHPFFAVVDWNEILQKKVKAPYVPVIKGDTDFSNFNNEFTQQPIDSYGVGDDLAQNSMNMKYPGFTYEGEDYDQFAK